MLAVYIAPNEFTVYGDKLQDFIVGRRLKFDCGVDGIYYSSVQSTSYIDPSTFITTTSGVLTSNLSSVLYGIINTGAEGSLPGHLHDGNEGQGDRISFNSLLDTDDVSKVSLFTDLDDTPNSYVPDKILKTTASGLVISDGLTFLELIDTPSTYTDKYTLKCTTSGIEFDQVAEWYVSEGSPDLTLGKRFDYYVDSSTNDLWRKDPGWVESSGAIVRNFDFTPANLPELNLSVWGSPVYNSTYYTFPSVSAALYSTVGTNHIDESYSDIKVRFKVYNRTLGTVQLIAGFGNITDGRAIGIDASNRLGVFGRNGGVLTSITIDSSAYKNYTWYILYASNNRLLLHEEGTLVTIEANGSCVSSNSTASACTNFGNSPNGNIYSVIANVSSQFGGDLDYVKTYNSGDLDFPDFSEANASWKKIGSVASNHMAFTGLSDTPDNYSQGKYLVSTASGIDLVNVPEWSYGGGAPVHDTGKLNDYYVDTFTNDLWMKKVGWNENSAATIMEFDIGSNDSGMAGLWLYGAPIDNGDYYTFSSSESNCLQMSDTTHPNINNMDIKTRVRVSSKSLNRTQNIYVAYDGANGIAIGINSSNYIGIFGRVGSTFTNISIPPSMYYTDIWYTLYASNTKVVLLRDGTSDTVTVTGNCSIGSSTNYWLRIGGTPNLQSPIDGAVNNFFGGDVDYVKFYNRGTLDFPDFSETGAEWEKIGSVASNHSVSFIELSDTPKSYTNGNYLRTTTSGIQSIDGIILTAEDYSEWRIKVTTSGVLYTEAI